MGVHRDGETFWAESGVAAPEVRTLEGSVSVELSEQLCPVKLSEVMAVFCIGTVQHYCHEPLWVLST